MASKPNSHPKVPWRLIGWAVPVALLLIPWLGNWPWTASDFIFAAVMFGIVGGTFELAVRASGNASYRLGAAAALATGFLTIWINLAVGIIGNEDNPANLIFFAVIGAAVVGAVVGRFEAAGMARAMAVAGAIQAAIGIGVFLLDAGASEPPGRVGLLMLIEFFALGWFVAAGLFHRAART